MTFNDNDIAVKKYRTPNNRKYSYTEKKYLDIICEIQSLFPWINSISYTNKFLSILFSVYKSN